MTLASGLPACGPSASSAVQSLRRGLSTIPRVTMCGGCVHRILLLSLVAMCLDTKDGCIWHACLHIMSVVITVCGALLKEIQSDPHG